MIGFSYPGIAIFATHDDDLVKALQTAISRALGVSVAFDLITPGLYAPFVPDFVISIGPKNRPSFQLTGSEAIKAAETTKRVNIKGIPAYTVTASTTWGASAKTIEIASDHFVVEFSSPAPIPATAPSTPMPAASATPTSTVIGSMASPTGTPSATATPAATATSPQVTGQLYWLAFHYP